MRPAEILATLGDKLNKKTRLIFAEEVSAYKVTKVIVLVTFESRWYRNAGTCFHKLINVRRACRASRRPFAVMPQRKRTQVFRHYLRPVTR